MVTSSPYLDSMRFELVASILSPALPELLGATDHLEGADCRAAIQVAATIEWLIGQAKSASTILKGADEAVAAQIYDRLDPKAAHPPPDQDEVEKAIKDIADNPRPAQPGEFARKPVLPATWRALEQAEQILTWSTSNLAIDARQRIVELRRVVT